MAADDEATGEQAEKPDPVPEDGDQAGHGGNGRRDQKQSAQVARKVLCVIPVRMARAGAEGISPLNCWSCLRLV